MTTPVVTSYEAEINAGKPANIFKALGGYILSAPITEPIPTAFTTATTADLIQQPATWRRLGLLTQKDGVSFNRDVKTDDETSWGFNEPTRTDITNDTTSAKFNLHQVSRAALELYHFVDLSAVTPDATTGEVSFNKPLVHAPIYYRMIYVAVDGAGTDRRYHIKIMPRAQVSAVDNLSWNQGNATTYGMTLRASMDTTLGYAVREVLAGPGQKSRNASQGFGS